MTHWPITTTDIIIAAGFLVIFVWDAFLLKKSESETISWRLAWWASRAPIVSVIVGIIVGHLFWPNHFYCQ